MWVFTSQGFISAVKHRDKANTLLVRARRAEHLDALLPGYPVTQSEKADYRYRCEVPRHALADILVDQVKAIEYDNFKNSIADNEYQDACSGVWAVMHRMQPGSCAADVTLARGCANDRDDDTLPDAGSHWTH